MATSDLRQLFDAESSTFTYLMFDEDGRGILIDPVFEQHRRDLALIQELGVTLVYIVETHVHADHITGAWLMREATDAKIAVSRAGGAQGADRLLDDRDQMVAGDIILEARATPGHTEGCMSFVDHDDERVFTGDALLIRGCGRTDFQGGAPETLYQSLKEQLFTLPGRYRVFPGHDYRGRTMSTIDEEKQHNPRVGGRADRGDFVGFMENLDLAHPRKIDVALPANLKLGEPSERPTSDFPEDVPVKMSFAGIPELDAEWVYLNRERITLVDVREDGELNGEFGRIDKSVHIPLGDLKARHSEVDGDLVVFVCRSGRRSGRACQMVDRVCANLAGGMLEWNARALPVERA